MDGPAPTLYNRQRDELGTAVMASDQVDRSESRKRRRPVVRIAAVSFGLLVILLGVWAIQGGAASLGIGPSSTTLRVGQPAPDFTLETVAGEHVRLSSYRGKTVLINFWATWCPPCQAEMPAINTVAREHPGLIVLAVDAMEGPVLVQRYQTAHPYAFQPLLDPSGKVVDLYHVDGLPTSFFVGPDGIIRAINIGPMTQSTIEKLASESG